MVNLGVLLQYLIGYPGIYDLNMVAEITVDCLLEEHTLVWNIGALQQHVLTWIRDTIRATIKPAITWQDQLVWTTSITGK